MLVQITLLMDNAHKFIWKAYDEPRNSSDIHTWWTHMKILMNPDNDHQKHNNILMIRMCTQIFK